ncbi:MAG: dTDP-glucose 4,6-dehydratase [Myxococcales bacterium]
MRLLVTGGAGFIGSNFTRSHLDAHPTDTVVVLDSLTYAGNLKNLAGLERHGGFRFVRGDICAPGDVVAAFDACSGDVDALVHFAAESHVDRSIDDAAPFVKTNVLGTQVLLDVARARGVGRFLALSTDEVYGSLGPDDAPFTEASPLAPSSPYSASKAGGDVLVRAAARTFGVPAIVVRASNTYGPYQFPEKLLPLFITNAFEERPLPLYGDGRHVRDWLYVGDLCDALERLLRAGRLGETYNVGGRCERENLTLARAICHETGKPESLIRHVSDRPGHDRRYALDTSRIEAELGWKPGPPIEDRLGELVRWYAGNRAWWEEIKSGAYRDYYAKLYGARLR